MFYKIQKLMKEKGVTAYKMAKIIGVDAASFTNWKKGKNKPSLDSLHKIADFFHVPLSYFYEDDSKGINIECHTNNGEINGIKNIISRNVGEESDELTIEMGELWRGLSREDKRQVLNYAKFISEQKK